MRITAWSYSRYALYELCPLKFKLKHIDKVPEPQAPAMERGDRIHKGVAAYILGKAEEPPQDAIAHPFPAKLIGEFRAFPDKVVEQQWGFTAAWQPTGWFGRATWFRNVLDAAALYEDLTGDVADWKTGKRYGSNTEQMELNALSFMCQYKPAIGVTTRMVYLDIGEEDVGEFKVSEKETLQAKWVEKVKPMFSDTVFAPRPNDKCRFCAFSRSNSGHCRFG